MTTAVAIALYNGARFIEEQLDTIRLQTRKPDQVVLCDDGSKDNTVQLVRDYIQIHHLENSWQLHENSENLGYIQNFYKAISLCNTDLVFLCDQDDIWKADKIEKMAAIIELHPNISLLSCRHGIIDAKGDHQHSLVEPASKEDGNINPVTVQDIMIAYRWPGMVMCIRKDFFDEIYSSIQHNSAAHDLMFAICAADRNAFFDYNYLGAFHRRHDSNVAREEHRIFKLLNMQRKLTDIAVTKKLWNSLICESVPITKESRALIQSRLALLEKREQSLMNRNLSQVLSVYKEDGGVLLRKASLICDIWLVLFSKS